MRAAPLLALLATPLAAQEIPTAAELLADFAARCAEIAENPRRAVNALADAPPDAEAVGGMTSDGALAQVSEPLVASDDLTVLLHFHQVVLEGRAAQTCSLSAFGFGGEPPFPDMLDRLVLGAEDILGARPVMQGGPVFGGQVLGGGRLALMHSWHVPGAGLDGPVLSLVQDERALTVNLARTVPAP